jgi:hypothetical protein
MLCSSNHVRIWRRGEAWRTLEHSSTSSRIRRRSSARIAARDMVRRRRSCRRSSMRTTHRSSGCNKGCRRQPFRYVLLCHTQPRLSRRQRLVEECRAFRVAMHLERRQPDVGPYSRHLSLSMSYIRLTLWQAYRGFVRHTFWQAYRLGVV